MRKFIYLMVIIFASFFVLVTVIFFGDANADDLARSLSGGSLDETPIDFGPIWGLPMSKQYAIVRLRPNKHVSKLIDYWDDKKNIFATEKWNDELDAQLYYFSASIKHADVEKVCIYSEKMLDFMFEKFNRHDAYNHYLIGQFAIMPSQNVLFDDGEFKRWLEVPCVKKLLNKEKEKQGIFYRDK